MSEKRKHTPGPWRAYETFYGHEIRMVPLDHPAKNHQLVEYDHGCFEDNGISPEQAAEAEANARLIAAAPELLEALEGLMEWEEEIAADLGMHTNPEPLLAKARAAIAKARLDGEEG